MTSVTSAIGMLARLASIRKKQQRGDAIKPSETGAITTYRMTFFTSRPVTWCILVIRRLIAFIYKHIFELTSPKTYESRLASIQKKQQRGERDKAGGETVLSISSYPE